MVIICTPCPVRSIEHYVQIKSHFRDLGGELKVGQQKPRDRFICDILKLRVTIHLESAHTPPAIVPFPLPPVSRPRLNDSDILRHLLSPLSKIVEGDRNGRLKTLSDESRRTITTAEDDRIEALLKAKDMADRAMRRIETNLGELIADAERGRDATREEAWGVEEKLGSLEGERDSLRGLTRAAWGTILERGERRWRRTLMSLRRGRETGER